MPIQGVPVTIPRYVVVSMFALMLPARAFADPKKEAVDAMNWGLEYCKDALNPDKGISEVKDNYEKFKKKLDTAVAADPSIRTWTGQLRGMKVNEGIAKCEKEIPERIARTDGGLATEGRDRALVNACLSAIRMGASASEWPQYEEKKAEVVKANKGPLTGEVATKLAKCEADHEAQLEGSKKFDAEVAADREKQRLAAVEEGKKYAAREKKLRASLKGDRGKIYDARGKPDGFDGDILATAKEWYWNEERKRYGETEYCKNYVRFKNNKKVKEWQEGYACKW
jgi:hypothetical protein